MPASKVNDAPLPGAIVEVFDRINAGNAASDAGLTAAQPTTVNASQIENMGSNVNQGRDPNSRGVYAGWPAMTPKHMRHRQGRQHEYFGTLARMYVRVGSKREYNKAIKSLAEKETKEIARKLMGDGDGAYGGLGYVDFLLQTANHAVGEKYQIVETLSDNYVAFFFGQQAPLFNYQGTLINTYQDDWAMRMFRLYRDIARGSQLARRGLLFYLRYDSMIVSGALTAFNFTMNADMQMAVPFTLQMLVKKVHILYGGLTTPTEVPSGDGFLPDGYRLVETTYQNLTPKIGKPSGDAATDASIPIDVPVALTQMENTSLDPEAMTEDELAALTQAGATSEELSLEDEQILDDFTNE